MENDLSKQVQIYSVKNKCFDENLQLNEKWLSERNIVSVFDSYLTRTLRMQPNTVSMDLLIVRMSKEAGNTQQLITQGFYVKEKYYMFLCSSAGQIKCSKALYD